MAKEAKTRVNYLLVIIFMFLLYFVFNRAVTPKFMPLTYLDELVPFTPTFSVIYSSYFIFLGLWVGYAFLNFPLHRYIELIWTLVGIQVVAYVAYVFFPSKILRPVLGEGVFETLTGWIYYIDSPTNLTPSLHVANSVLLAMFMFRVRSLRLLVWIWAALIVMSTMAVKQHYFVDVVSGVGLSVAAYFLVERYISSKENLNGSNGHLRELQEGPPRE